MVVEKIANNSVGISRRRLIKGAAWSVPVVAAAVTAPAWAASACKQVGDTWESRASSANWNSAKETLMVTVPAMATRMHFVVVGGDGGAAHRYQSSDRGLGKGAYLEGYLSVAPGENYGLQPGAGGEYGWMADYGGGLGRGGKSGYGHGGDGTPLTSSGLRGHGGGGASALVNAVGEPLVVAGGGGGSNINVVPEGPHEALYSGSLYHDQVAVFGSSSVTARGGESNAGMPGSRGNTGSLGWLGQRPAAHVPPGASEIILMSGGGQGGGAQANAGGSGGAVEWVSGPNFANDWVVAGFSGSGRVGGGGAISGPVSPDVSAGAAGGGGGGYSGGGGGSSASTQWWGATPESYADSYGIAGSGGGGSSFVSAAATDLVSMLDPRTTSGLHGEMGYVQVTFYTC